MRFAAATSKLTVFEAGSETDTKKAVQCFTPSFLVKPEQPIVDISWSPDGQLLCAATSQNLRLYDRSGTVTDLIDMPIGSSTVRKNTLH